MRPCCGHFVTACTCKPPAGLQKPPLDALAARYRTTPLKTVRDTTDVSIFQRLMQQRCESLPIWVVLLYSFVHVMFNQEQLLKAMVDEKAFLFKPPWVNWTGDCTICFEPVVATETLWSCAMCSCVVHMECKHLSRNRSCPTCRSTRETCTQLRRPI